jgi:hypothetical protein
MQIVVAEFDSFKDEPPQVEEAAEKLQNCHPEGRVCPRDLLFSPATAKKQIPRFARDDK